MNDVFTSVAGVSRLEYQCIISVIFCHQLRSIDKPDRK